MHTKGYSFKVDSGQNSVIGVPHGKPHGDEVVLVTFTLQSVHPVSSHGIVTMAEALLDALTKMQPTIQPVPGFATQKLWKKLDQTVDEFEFSSRTAHDLKARLIRHIGELVQKTPDELMGHTQPPHAHKRVKEIKEIIATLGLELGMTPEQLQSWVRPDQRGK